MRRIGENDLVRAPRRSLQGERVGRLRIIRDGVLDPQPAYTMPNPPIPAGAAPTDGNPPALDLLKSIAVPPELGKMAPVGERAAKVYASDWTVINDKREEWTKRWNREVER